MLGRFGPMLGPCCVHVGPMLGHLVGYVGFHGGLWNEQFNPTENFSVEVIFGGTWRAMSDQCWAVLEDTLGTTILEGLTSKTVLAGSLY